MKSNSSSTRTLNLVLQKALSYNGEIRLLNLFDTELPIYRPTKASKDHQNIRKATEDVLWADAYILASPDYHGSMSGTMKNFLDYFWKEFAGKTFGYIVASHEKGLTVMDQMRTAVRQCYGWSLPYGISINGEKDFNKNGEIINDELKIMVDMMSRDLVVYGNLIYAQFKNDMKGTELSFANKYND